MTELNAVPHDEFRALVRSELVAHYPDELRYPARRLTPDVLQGWTSHLVARGWIAPGWPVEHGGMGLDAARQLIFAEEFERYGVARDVDHGIVQVGPVIMRHGTAAQRERWLPPIIAYDHRWAQGYSEPEAGSDLASLRTKAVRDGDDFIIDGQKIWTTLAHHATHIYFLARTNPDVKKQAGISFFLAALDSPGITVRPIRDIAGHEELCEVFFDGVVVPEDQLIGEENMGWTVAKSLLGHERINMGSPKLPEYGLAVLTRAAQARGLLEDPVFADRLAAAQLDVKHLADAYEGYVAQVVRGEELGPDVSMLKIWATETFSRIADLTLEFLGEAGALHGERVPVGESEIDVLGAFYKARPSTIYGGTNEIQRNILATSVLGLPRG